MHCPVCKAANDQGPQCRRCRADLALLFRLADQRRAALDEAGRAAARGHWGRALAIAEGADALRSDSESRAWLLALRLLHRDHAAAWRDYVGRQRSG